MGEQEAVTGPDLAAGVPLGQLPDDGVLLGHVGDEAVVLVRKGEEIFAVGASCTHYGGPLAEGLVVGETIRCPWHHACFSLRTGEAVAAPALDPITTWKVARKGDVIRVTDQRAAPAAPAKPTAPASVVIVGAGAAGLAAAQMLRREGYAGPVTLVGIEESGPVDRPNLSKDYLAGTAQEDWLPLRPAEFYAENKIELITDSEVTAIDPSAKQVTLADERTLPYGALLLATGAEPIRPSLPGADLPHVYTLRSQKDSQAIIAAAERAKRAVVLGASFIGLEVAASLRARELEVHVVAPGARPLEKVMGPEVGAFVQSLHEAKGVVFHLGQPATAIADDSVTLKDGTTLPADLVVLGVGVQPRTALAEAAGLQVDNGVLVDEYLTTSAPDIYAAGDIARYPDPRTGERARMEHWVVAERQGQAAARNILGRKDRYVDVPFFWSQHYDLALNYVGHAPRWDTYEIDGSLAAKDATVTYRLDGQRLAVLTVGRDRANLEAEAAMEHATTDG